MKKINNCYGAFPFLVFIFTFLLFSTAAFAYPTLKWRYDTGANVAGSPAIAPDGTIYVVRYNDIIHSNYQILYAFNADGTLKWSYTLGTYGSYSSPAIGSDGTIYVGSHSHKVYAFNPDGTVKWIYSIGCEFYSSPAIGSDGTIYIGSLWGNLYAINADGTLKWLYDVGGYIDCSPSIGGDGTIYIGSRDNRLCALNPDGTLKWSYLTGGDIYSSPAIGSDGAIYVGSYDDYLYAINGDGSLRWRYLTGGNLRSSPSIGSDGTIYVGSNDGYLYAINSDGSLKWKYSTGAEVKSSPAIGSDGAIYVGSYDDYLYAINADGSLRWRYLTGDNIFSSPTIDSDGTIYFGSQDGYLYALGYASEGLATTPWPKFRHNVKNTAHSSTFGLDDLIAISRKTDLDNDGDNDGSDLSIFIAAYGFNSGEPNYNINADFDNDGDVDQIDLSTFLRIFGSSDLPLILPNVPVLNQSRYTDNENYPDTYVESVANIAAGGCAPVSFAMLFLGHYNEFGPTLPIVETSYNSQNTLNLMDDITQKLSVLIPVSEWQVFMNWSVDQTMINEQQVLAFMDNYSFTFDSTDYVVEAVWDIDFECATIISNDQLIRNVLNRLNNNESIYFLGNINKFNTGEAGNHASIISGYAKFDGIEYFRVNDTYSDIPSWYRIERGDVCVINNSCSTNYCPIKLIGKGGNWVFEVKWSIAWPQSVVFTVVPKY